MYPEYSTEHFNSVANITVDSDGITPQKKQNGIEVYIQEYHKIPFNQNEASKIIIAIKTIEPNASAKFDPKVSGKMNKSLAIKLNKLRTIKVNKSHKKQLM